VIRRLIAQLLVVVMFLGLAPRAGSHHSIAAGFDVNETVTVTGTIKEMDWTNPHARLYFDVEHESGEIQSWIVWFSSANNLYRRGWRDTDLPVGDTVTVSGFPARDGSKELYGGETKTADGRTLFGGSPTGR